MATKKELQKQAEEAGITVSSSATKKELEEALAEAEGGSAGVEGRSLDTKTETPNALQEDAGTFEKVYVVQGGEPSKDDLDRYERNVRQQAQQAGLRTTGDVKLVKRTTKKHRRSESTRLVFHVPVVTAFSALGDEEPTVSEVASNEEAEKEPVKPSA